MDELGTDGAKCSRKVDSRRSVVGAIRLLVNARDLQLECAKVLHETLFAPVLTYSKETMLWKNKERSRIRAVEMDNLRDLLGIRRNTWRRELYGVMKEVDKRIEGGVLQCFGHVERMERDRIA